MVCWLRLNYTTQRTPLLSPALDLHLHSQARRTRQNTPDPVTENQSQKGEEEGEREGQEKAVMVVMNCRTWLSDVTGAGS